MKWFSASIAAMVSLACTAAMASPQFSISHPTQADVPAISNAMRASAAKQLGVTSTQVKITMAPNLVMPTGHGFSQSWASLGTATAGGKTLNYFLGQGRNGKFTVQPAMPVKP